MQLSSRTILFLTILPEWNEKPDSCSPMKVWGDSNYAIPPNCEKLTNLTAAVYWNRFVSLAEQFLEKHFTPEMMKERVDFWAKIIEPMMIDEPFIEQETWINNFEKSSGWIDLHRNNQICCWGFNVLIKREIAIVPQNKINTTHRGCRTFGGIT